MSNMLKKLTVIFLLLITIFTPLKIHADDEQKIVRVGWHEEPYFITDEYGRWSGYTYEYQRKIAAYTGWKYEYVEGSWSQLLQMLKDGEIDMMGNVSFTEERAKELLFASSAMGTESYYLFVSPDENRIKEEDYSSINNKRVGVTKGSIQSEMFRNWAETHSLTPQIIELSGMEEESLELLGKKIDAFVTVDVYGDQDTSVPLWKIGSSDFYFALNKDRSDLLIELNAAMSSIQSENAYFNEQLHEKYLSDNQTIYYLNDVEKDWLFSHDIIRVGYQDNYLAFCAKDTLTGELIGALKDYLDYAKDGFENAQLHFEAVCYPTAGAALEALKKGEIDCMFPANLTEYESESLGVLTTPAFMTTEMDAVVRASDQKEFVRKQDVIVAVNEGNTNYEMFLKDNYPGWQIKYYRDTLEGLNGIYRGEADCVIISNYRFSNIAKQCEKLNLTTIYTGVDLDYSLAVREGETELYSILTKVSKIVPNSVVNSALTYYSTEDAKTTFLDVIRNNIIAVLVSITMIFSLIIMLLIRDIRAQKKIVEEEWMLNALNKKVFVDALTSVRNKGAYSNYIQDLQDKIDSGEPVRFAIGVFDCNDLKHVNDSHGHDKGDIYLKKASRLICEIFQHSPVFRIGGDEFAVILENEDLDNKDELVKQFETVAKQISSSAGNLWEQVHLALGVAEYDPELDGSVIDTSRRADKIMYENKRLSKQDKQS